jgi:aspartyl-tRNA(Asn)/glutamyl-tRNA(Gln) amidotransferase subunit A
VVCAFDASLEALSSLGARIQTVELPYSRFAIPVYYLVANAEASSNLARFDGVRYGRREAGEDLVALYSRTRGRGFGPEVRRRILLGTFALSAGYHDEFYRRAQRARTRIVHEYEGAFTRCDLMLLPTTPTLPFRLGEKTDDPLAMYLSDLFTIGANLAGIPGLSVPMGLAPGGLPVAVQLLGPADSEPALLRAGRVLEVDGDPARLGRNSEEKEFLWPRLDHS